MEFMMNSMKESYILCIIMHGGVRFNDICALGWWCYRLWYYGWSWWLIHWRNETRSQWETWYNTGNNDSQNQKLCLTQIVYPFLQFVLWQIFVFIELHNKLLQTGLIKCIFAAFEMVMVLLVPILIIFWPDNCMVFCAC